MGLLIGSELAVLRARRSARCWSSRRRCPGPSARCSSSASRRDLPTTSFTAWQLLIGGVPIAIGALLLEEAHWRQIRWPATFAVCYNIVVAFVFCYWAWYKIVSRTSAGVSALGTLMIPVVGVFSSMLVLGERPAWQEYAALALVIAAIATVVVPARSHAALVWRSRCSFVRRLRLRLLPAPDFT